MDEHPASPEDLDPDPGLFLPAAAKRRPRGRRGGGADTRQQILDAARAEFDELGYAATSLRGIARRAGVDPAMVRYWFEGGKAELLSSSLMHPRVNPARVAESIYAGPIDTLGERVVSALLKLWDFPGGPERIKLVFGAAVGGRTSGAVAEYLIKEVFGKVADRLPGPNAPLRVSLVASQVTGLILARYVLELEPLASAPAEDVVRLVAPNIQRYIDLTEVELGGLASGGPELRGPKARRPGRRRLGARKPGTSD